MIPVGAIVKGVTTAAKIGSDIYNKIEAKKQTNGQVPLNNKSATDLASAAANLLANIPASIANQVPGLAALAKALPSSLNDDEWFEKYTATGATFNEQLKMTNNGSITYTVGGTQSPIYQFDATPGFAVVYTHMPECHSGVAAGDQMAAEYYEEFMPAILAHIRDKNNNVLMDDVEKYRDTFIYASELYILYYELMRCEKLWKNLPLNIPNLSDVTWYLNPVETSNLRMIAETLGDYLESTVKLPAAWVAYLRWRFGTTFYSENTGKPALIWYWNSFREGQDSSKSGVTQWDILPLIEIYPTGTAGGTGNTNGIAHEVTWKERAYSAVGNSTKLNKLINYTKTKIAECGRAAADFKVAYANHEFKRSVDDPHYDVKEFNARINAQSSNSVKAGNTDKYVKLHLDSRLKMESAIQSVSMTVGSNLGVNREPNPQGRCPFPVEKVSIATYYQGVALPIIKCSSSDSTLFDGMGDSQVSLKDSGKYSECFVAKFADGWYATIINEYSNSSEIMTTYDMTGYRDLAGGIVYKLTNGNYDYTHMGLFTTHGPSRVFSGPSVATPDLAASFGWVFYIAELGARAMQFHEDGETIKPEIHPSIETLRRGTGLTYPDVFISASNLAYDTALISYSQLRAIQRTAMRNLTRGDFLGAISVNKEDNAVQAVETLQDTALGIK